MNQHEDHRYIEALRNGNSRAIAELYEHHSDTIIKWISGRGGSLDDAKDVFQEAMKALFEKAQDKNYVQQHPIGAFIMRMCQYIFYNRIRGEKREGEVRNELELLYKDDKEEDQLSLIVQATEKAARVERLAKAFQQLSETCKKLLEWVKAGLDPQQIVDQMGFNSTNTYYRRKSACISSWKNHFQKLNAE
ncbi:MAG: RNA polymerase sigma factor [Chitinophagales bacterium]|nr:RNA polymerase sigma factor [Chitinophagales bacterium]